ncbi:SGNH hydrolase-type esterase domain-containing protein [Xylaria arbuscula]|nr:SGNH hydrolase-type esterase domain-containing protein [Xylaria arbuscula]
MCLGASVARGAVSIGNLGFRSPLRNKLAALGNPINFVGSQRLGAFKDNDLEAYAGGRIDQIHAHAEKIVPQLRPNVFVIHVGSNDCLQKHDTANAYERYRDFVLYLLTTSTRATVIISTLLTNTVPSQEPCILDVNIQIRRVASELQRQGRRVVFAEMHCEQGYPDRPVVADISPDGTHPFDHGYELMADIFFEAFLQADKRGFLQTLEQNGIPEDGELERSHEPELFEPPPPKKPKPAPQQAQTAENKNKVKDGDNGKTDTTADTKAEDTKDKATVVADDKVLPATGTVTDTQTGVAGDIETTTTAETKATPVAGLVVGDNGDLVYNGEKVGTVVEGDAEKLKGMGADEEGNILDSAGNKVGFAVPLDAVLDPVSGAIDNKGTATDTQIDPKPVADNTAATPLEVKTNNRIENNLRKTI